MSKTFITALLISLGIHISGMSLVAINIPENIMTNSTYPRVDFLGPILKKTAFDIMLEHATPIVRTSYSFTDFTLKDKILKVPLMRTKLNIEEFPKKLENDMDNLIQNYFQASKIVPRFALDSREAQDLERRVIYKPSPPFIIKGLYGDKEFFKVKALLGVSRNGKVKDIELITTTGYASLDITISKFLKSWIFEPNDETAESVEKHEVEVIIETVK